MLPFCRSAASLAAFLAVAACSSGPVNLTPRPTPTPGFACPALAVEGPQVLYPVPGATGVPATAGSIVLYGGLIASGVVELQPPTPALDLGTPGPLPSPEPSPAATAQYPQPNVTANAVSYPALAAATTYTISFKDMQSPCPVAIEGGATFTTAVSTASSVIRARPRN